MPISEVSLNQAMRPGEISAINALNEVIDVVNDLDLTTVLNRLSTVENSVTALNTTVYSPDTPTNGLVSKVGALETASSGTAADITQIKQTLYTPLNQNVPDPS